MKKILIRLYILFVFCGYYNSGNAQNHSVFVGTQIPLQYSIGYSYQISPKFSSSLQLGLLTKPYDKIILNILDAMGTDDALTNTIGESFSYGLLVQPTVYWHWNEKYYIGVYGQWTYLRENDAPKDVIEAYYGTDIDTAPSKRNRQRSGNSLTLESNLYNLGLLVGRSFFFKNPRLQLRIELATAKTLTSSSQISSEARDLSTLSEKVDVILGDYYWNYGYIPTLNVYLVYQFGK